MIELVDELDEQIKEWQKLKAWLTVAKDRESTLRGLIAKAVFEEAVDPTGAYKEGTNHNSVNGASHGYKLKLVGKRNRKIIEEVMVATVTEAGLTPAEANALVKVKYELSDGTYKKLAGDKKAIVDKMIIETPASFELEVSVIPK